MLRFVLCVLSVSAYILAENVKKLGKYTWFLSFDPFSLSKVDFYEDFILFWQKNWSFIFPYFSFRSSTFRQCMIQKGFYYFSADKIQDTVVPKEIMPGVENSKKWFRCIPIKHVQTSFSLRRTQLLLWSDLNYWANFTITKLLPDILINSEWGNNKTIKL